MIDSVVNQKGCCMANTALLTDVSAIWKNPRLIVLTAVSSALYAAAYIVLAPFSIHLIPGVLGIALRGVMPLAMGLLFGPAGALGVGIGNTIGDVIGGSLGPGSPFAFLSNFLLAYLPYRYWRRKAFGIGGPGYRLLLPEDRHRGRSVVAFGVAAVLIGAAGAIPLAWGLNLLGFVPFRVSVISLFVNFALGNLASGLLYTLIAPRVARINMTWDAIVAGPLPDRTTAVRSTGRVLGVALTAGGGVSGCLLGLTVGSSAATPLVAVPLLAVLIGAALI
ncbi:hypothetical protein ACFWDQ_07690 [Streptomyces sp. NPDC060053]|uniref:hypothetical protein n=1 Tax=Streptomyces sp. NPDC060053 TaxID=3347047 RepID=UPI00369379EB